MGEGEGVMDVSEGALKCRRLAPRNKLSKERAHRRASNAARRLINNEHTFLDRIPSQTSSLNSNKVDEVNTRLAPDTSPCTTDY